jgi:triosephosphate isomerase
VLKSKKPLIAGNWKMNKNLEEISKFVDVFLKSGVENNKKDVLICPSYLHIEFLIKKLKPYGVKIGAQNCHFREKGPFTGEVSAPMFKEIGVDYVMVGHSECRTLRNESNENINLKLLNVLKNTMHVVLCVGETLEERKNFRALDIILNQIMIGLNNVKNFDEVFIAYEPVWAIGSGKLPDLEDIKNIMKNIRDFVRKKYGIRAADEIGILYGGSVDSCNSSKILSIKNVDGLLVGSASLNIKEFIKIIKS